MVRPDSGARRGALSAGPLPVERFFQFSLLGLVASGYLAVAGSGYLDAPTVALTGAGLLLRALLLSGMVRLDLTERTATLVALGYAGFFPLDYFFLSHDFLAATVHLVFFLAVAKTLTAKTHRDSLNLAVIAFLELLAAAILSINFNFFLCLALFLVFSIAALTSGEIRRAMLKATTTARGGLKRFHSRLALLAMWIALGILALTAGMFFLLPRTADAALSTLISHRIRIPGFSDHVTLGEIGEFKSSSRVVMHIAIYGNQPMGSAKWRGGALTEFDGQSWSNPSRVFPAPFKSPDIRILPVDNGHVDLPSASQRTGALRSYRVELAELDSPALFFAGAPEHIDGLPGGSLQATETGCFRLGRIPPSGFHYYAYSVLEEPPESAAVLHPPPILDLDRRTEEYLQLPRLDPRIGELALAMTAGASTDLARARAVEQRLRHDYGYTLELPQREPADPLADFLFTRRKGHCEYFASAMAVMLRTLGIPSRLATGFQSGVYNPISDLWMVRASDAHSWVEAWIPGHGWTTFDPTPPDLSAHSPTLFSKAGLYLDAAETFWQQWVVGYDPGHQGTLADHIEQTARWLGIRWFDSVLGLESHWTTYAKAWIRQFGMRIVWGIALAYSAWFGAPRLYRFLRLRRRVQRVRRGQASVGDATLLYERMLHALKRQGFQKPVWFTPLEFARSLPASQLGAAVREFTGAYNALRFGGRTTDAIRLSTLLDELERGTQPR
jgi:transglutaminase-like putative cysteine protease